MPNDITVLGIHDGHDAGVALVKDGSVVATIQEERMKSKIVTGLTPQLSVPEILI